jgi:hypothetical protein
MARVGKMDARCFRGSLSTLPTGFTWPGERHEAHSYDAA